MMVEMKLIKVLMAEKWSDSTDENNGECKSKAE
jgi:hypothetical protein